MQVMNACLPDLHAHVMDALYLLTLVRGPKVLKGTKVIKDTKGSKGPMDTKVTKATKAIRATKDTKGTKGMWVEHHNVGNVLMGIFLLILQPNIDLRQKLGPKTALDHAKP